MFEAIDISTSGLVAQRVRLTAAAMNLANVDTVFDPATGGPYQRRSVEFSAGMKKGDHDGQGVHVSDIRREDVFRTEYDPSNPYADANGYVKLPGIEPLVEMVNAMEAQRAYEANLTAIDLSKAMLNSTLRLLA